MLICGRSPLGDKIELEMVDFDVILGMDWLESCHVMLIIEPKIIRF